MIPSETLAYPVSRTSTYLFPASTGFYFAARLTLSYLFFQAEPRTGAIAGLALNLAFFIGSLFYVFGGRAHTVPITTPFRWALCFLTVSLVSLSWSVTVSIPIAAGYWSGIAADVAIVWMILRYQPLNDAGESLMKGYVWGACFIAIVTWFSPTMQDLRPGDDEYFSPNAIGFICVLGVYFSQYLNRAARGWRFTPVFLSITLMRTLSKSTILAFCIAQAYLLLRDRTVSAATRRTAIMGTIVVFALFWPLISSYYVVYTNAGNQAETLTGRVGIWGFVLLRALESPWIGHGFHGFRNVIPAFGDFEAWHAHNELIQQFYTYGVLGLVMFVGIYASFYRHVRQASSQVRTLFHSLLLFILIRGLADTDRFELSLPMWAILLISTLVYAPALENEVTA
ncbi:MAG: O-antigen ligase family protein [Acidobacteria bacterium]|nr:O-antigen ligase family protein [Acidobacteriota bacterium]